MDPLITVSQAHNKVYEMLNMYQKLLLEVNHFDVSDYVKTLNKLFTDTVKPHFEFEEVKIFPIVFARKDLGLEKIISELLQEHRQMIKHLAGISEKNAGIMNSSNPAPAEKDSLLASCNILARELVVHTQKEDSQLYPKIKEIMFNM